MLIDSNRIANLLESEKEDFLRQYNEYLDQISQGNPRVKSLMSKKDRVLLVVLANFLHKHAKNINLPIGDKLGAAETLIPVAKKIIETERVATLTTQE